jgi:hypothetical protein
MIWFGSVQRLGLIYDFHYVGKTRLKISGCKRISKTWYGQFRLGIVLANPGLTFPRRNRAHSCGGMTTWTRKANLKVFSNPKEQQINDSLLKIKPLGIGFPDKLN